MSIDVSKYTGLYENPDEITIPNYARAIILLNKVYDIIKNKVQSEKFEEWLQAVLDNNIETIKSTGYLYISFCCQDFHRELHFVIEPFGCYNHMVNGRSAYCNQITSNKVYFKKDEIIENCEIISEMIEDRLYNILGMRCPKYDRTDTYGSETTLFNYHYLISFQ